VLNEAEICSHFDTQLQQRMDLVNRQDAIGFNYRQKTLWFINRLQNVSGRLLDIGCNGQNGISAGQLEYTGIDIAEESIHAAKHRNIPGTAFQVASILQLPFPDESFDAVTMMEVIEHVPDQSAAMAETARVLKPNGLLLLSTPNADCKPWLFDERLKSFALQLLGRKVLDRHTPLTLSALVNILLQNNLTLLDGSGYYWYRPYHILKGSLWWPPHLAVRGLLSAMKYCINIEQNGLTMQRKCSYCQSIVINARKKINFK